MKKRNIWLVLCIVFTALIFCRSFKSANESTEESSLLVNLVESSVRKFIESPPGNLREIVTVIVRKLAHIAEFALQSCLICGFFSTFKGRIKGNISWILFAGLLTACIDEAIQLTSEGRAGLITDVFIDFGGTLVGICVSLLFVRIISAKKKKA